jgi:hypothetical protein
MGSGYLAPNGGITILMDGRVIRYLIFRFLISKPNILAGKILIYKRAAIIVDVFLILQWHLNRT